MLFISPESDESTHAGWLHDGETVVCDTTPLHYGVGLEDGLYCKFWVLTLDTNGEAWRLRCH